MRYALALLVLLGAPAALAQPGAFDASFGDGGIVQAHFFEHDRAFGVAIQPDGRIVVGGYSGVLIAPPRASDFLLARFLSDGTPDPSFGDGGYVLADRSDADYDAGYALALQPDGKILLAGTTRLSGGTRDFALLRFLPEGTPDPDFGEEGLAVVDLQGGIDYAYGLLLQPDGAVVLTGYAGRPGGEAGDLALVRVLPDGTPDAGFGDGGRVLLALGVSAYGNALALQPDGKVLALGTTRIESGPRPRSDLVLARYLPDGTLDPDFGDGGYVVADHAGQDFGSAVVVLPDGRIVVAGNGDEEAYQTVLARFHPDGTPDPTFANGIASSAFECRALVRLPDGRLLIGGTSVVPGQNRFAIARYEADGALDPTFGEDGVASVSVASIHVGRALAVQPDGRAVLAGYLSNAGDVVLMRVHGDGGSVATETEPVPAAFALSAPSPHPFRDGARLTLAVPSAQAVRVAVYDLLGREVAVLLDGAAEAGTHMLTLGGGALAAGVYVVRAEGADGAAVRRVVRY